MTGLIRFVPTGSISNGRSKCTRDHPGSVYSTFGQFKANHTELWPREHHIPPPNKLITATGGGLPSLCFVCPQYAKTYFDGCQVTVGDGARAGTRCSGILVSVAHLISKSRDQSCAKIQERGTTYYINVRSSTGYRQIFAIKRKTKGIDGVPAQKDIITIQCR